MYTALITFRDLEDRHLYQKGDRFPFDGREISEQRINALISGKNRASKPLIVKVEEEPQQEAPKKPRRKPKKQQGD